LLEGAKQWAALDKDFLAAIILMFFHDSGII
jgi:hypothetical protein